VHEVRGGGDAAAAGGGGRRRLLASQGQQAGGVQGRLAATAARDCGESACLLPAAKPLSSALIFSPRVAGAVSAESAAPAAFAAVPKPARRPPPPPPPLPLQRHPLAPAAQPHRASAARRCPPAATVRPLGGCGDNSIFVLDAERCAGSWPPPELLAWPTRCVMLARSPARPIFAFLRMRCSLLSACLNSDGRYYAATCLVARGRTSVKCTNCGGTDAACAAAQPTRPPQPGTLVADGAGFVRTPPPAGAGGQSAGVAGGLPGSGGSGGSNGCPPGYPANLACDGPGFLRGPPPAAPPGGGNGDADPADSGGGGSGKRPPPPPSPRPPTPRPKPKPPAPRPPSPRPRPPPPRPRPRPPPPRPRPRPPPPRPKPAAKKPPPPKKKAAG
jgi:hypothetical protein